MSGLTLKRLVGESIRIGETVVVTLVRVSQGRADIHVEAPKGVPIEREPTKQEKPR